MNSKKKTGLNINEIVKQLFVDSSTSFIIKCKRIQMGV